MRFSRRVMGGGWTAWYLYRWSWSWSHSPDIYNRREFVSSGPLESSEPPPPPPQP